jgi:hypothetical protein
VTITETALDYATRHKCAAFILREAQLMGIRVGTDGNELVMIAPMRVPRETRLWFETKLYEYKAEIIDFIQRENAARTGELVPDAVDAEGAA